MDPLSDLLRVVRMDGAFFYAVQAGEPWSVEAPPARELAPRIMPTADHLISYHILIEGRCWGGLVGEDQVEMAPGDVIVFPQGDAHVMSSDRGVRLRDDRVQSAPVRYPFTLRLGSEGPPATSFLCGFLGCDRRPFNPLLAALPRQIHMPRRSNTWLSGFTDLLREESLRKKAGVDSVITRLAEVMFIQVLRQHLEASPSLQTGWLAGLQDPLVSRALALLHERPGHAWTLAELTDQTASSRSNLSKRFTELVGQPPMQYLAQWRMQVAANLLTETAFKIGTVAIKVGYDSEAAFSRAFKRTTGLAPGAWRAARRAAAG